MSLGHADEPKRLEHSLVRYIPFPIVVVADILVIWAVAVVAALCVIAGAPVAVRTLFGLPLVFFIPGYALVTLLFPGRGRLDGVERIALSFGLSLAVLSLIALGIDYSRWPLSLGPILSGLLISTLAFSIAGAWRRLRTPNTERLSFEMPRLRWPSPGEWDTPTRVAGAILAVSLVLFVAAGSALLAARSSGDPMTEFAIYNIDGQPAFYPREIAAGGSEPVILEITNRESDWESYWLRAMSDGVETGRIEGIHLAVGERWHEVVELRVSEPGELIPITIELYRSGDDQTDGPYRELRLTVTGVDGNR